MLLALSGWSIRRCLLARFAKTNLDDPVRPSVFSQLSLGRNWVIILSELNDPIDQLHRFVEQQAMREAGDEEAMMLDIDFVEMLEYGMPPACGFSYSERLFWIFEGVTAREGVPFPQLRTEIDDITKALYPDVDLMAELINEITPDQIRDNFIRLGRNQIALYGAVNVNGTFG